MARIESLVIPHHVTQRGNRRQQTFLYQANYQLNTDLVAGFAQETGTDIWAYLFSVLKGNPP